MSNTTFSDNLKRLRLSKKYTQEFVAEKWGVSPQSVSRWECGNTLPDVLLLPEIAKIYCVTVDDLFRENALGYENYARRLLAVFESTGKTEDFVLAEAEFKRILASGDGTPLDKLMFGVVYQKMMWLSRRTAGRIYDEVIADPETDDNTRRRAVRQRIYFLANTGKGEQVISEQLEKVQQDDCTSEDMLGLMMAYHHAGRADEGFKWFEKAVKTYPDEPKIYVYGGNMCEQLERFDEALHYWGKAYEMDKGMRDVLYSIAFCYEDMGQMDKAKEVWSYMAQDFRASGFDVEAELAASKARAI